MRRTGPLALLAAATFVACGDDEASTSTSTSTSTSGSSSTSGVGGAGGGETGPSPSQLAAAAELAGKDCEAFEKCVPITFATTFADQADCAEKGAVFWASLMLGPDSGGTLESVATCGAELDLSTCDAWWSLNYGAGTGACKRTGLSRCEDERVFTHGDGPASCFPRGARGAGEPCGHGTQCASGICNHDQSPGLACSTCAEAADGAGDRCGDGIMCRGQLVCAPPVCAELGGEYDPCGLCLPHLICFASQCKQRRAEGLSCDPTAPYSRATCGPDLLCDPASSTCERLQVAGVGERCGALSDGGVARCELGAACKVGEQPDLATCVPRIALGGACTTGYLFGSGCEPPGDCVEGRCQLRGPELCP